MSYADVTDEMRDETPRAWATYEGKECAGLVGYRCRANRAGRCVTCNLRVLSPDAYAVRKRHDDCANGGITCGEEGCPALADPAVFCEAGCGLIHAGDCETAARVVGEALAAERLDSLFAGAPVPEPIAEDPTERVTVECGDCGAVLCASKMGEPCKAAS